MGLVSRRNTQLDELFDQFAVDPKRRSKMKPDDDKEKEQAEDKDEKESKD